MFGYIAPSESSSISASVVIVAMKPSLRSCSCVQITYAQPYSYICHALLARCRYTAAAVMRCCSHIGATLTPIAHRTRSSGRRITTTYSRSARTRTRPPTKTGRDSKSSGNSISVRRRASIHRGSLPCSSALCRARSHTPEQIDIHTRDRHTRQVLHLWNNGLLTSRGCAGDLVNRFKHGSLVMRVRAPSARTAPHPRL
eukprot:2281942-Rhodomonas_salina.1